MYGILYGRDEDPTFFSRIRIRLGKSADPDPVGTNNADPDPTLNRNEKKK